MTEIKLEHNSMKLLEIKGEGREQLIQKLSQNYLKIILIQEDTRKNK
ncbi:hypothetical protein [Lactococcus lactis]|nr:hypothetical protein [Lactococcus lactis]